MRSNDPLEARLKLLADMQALVDEENDELNELLAEYETELDMETLSHIAAAGPPHMSFKQFREILENDEEKPE